MNDNNNWKLWPVGLIALFAVLYGYAKFQLYLEEHLGPHEPQSYQRR